MMTIIGIYLVLTFVMLKFSFAIASKLIAIGAVAGVLFLMPVFRTEISMIISIIALVYIIKRYFLQH